MKFDGTNSRFISEKSNDGATRCRITAYQSGTCATLESVQLNLISEAAILSDVSEQVVYLPLCIQMIEQPGLNKVLWLLVVSSFNYFKMHAWSTSMLIPIHYCCCIPHLCSTW